MLPTQSKNKEKLTEELRALTGQETEWTQDVRDNRFGWLRLTSPSQLTPTAELLAKASARLCTVTAYSDRRDDPENRRSVAYHFALFNDSTVLTVTTPAYDESGAVLALPSITPIFRNADWNEREMHEMFDISVESRADDKRLFLDERLETGIMTQVVPFSSMVHGAATKELWEQVMAAKGIEMEKEESGEPHLVPGAEAKAPVEEPKFTPVSSTEPAQTEEAAPKE